LHRAREANGGRVATALEEARSSRLSVLDHPGLVGLVDRGRLEVCDDERRAAVGVDRERPLHAGERDDLAAIVDLAPEGRGPEAEPERRAGCDRGRGSRHPERPPRA
jgi:hypothetical protein